MQARSTRREGLRKRVQRNILTVAVNTALTQRTIGPKDGENFWIGAPKSVDHIFQFVFPGGIPAACYVHDLGGELAFHVALWPHRDLSRLACSNANQDAGEVFVTGWLERRLGPWLQDAYCNAWIPKERLYQLAGLNIEPVGYRVGPFIL
jgi:hypothetical protein